MQGPQAGLARLCNADNLIPLVSCPYTVPEAVQENQVHAGSSYQVEPCLCLTHRDESQQMTLLHQDGVLVC